jgi:hypothetical protein
MEKVAYKKKNYIHFDRVKGIAESRKWIENPENIIHHDFMPFIHFEQKTVKYTSPKGRKPKYRDLSYCAHIDAYIYQLYAHKLIKLFNEKAKVNGINKCVTAYRNNFHGKCNIHFAYDVFKFIRNNDDCLIIIGDFTKFFDRLDHNYLKQQCCNLLDVQMLPDDYYKVFKSIIKYSYFELTDLLKLTNSKNFDEFNDSEKRKIALPIEQFREAKKSHLKKNRKNYGIPQGSPLSAVFANTYMLDFDKAVNNFVTSSRGLYRRYSDDFVIVLPFNNQENKAHWQYINEIINGIPKLHLQPDKTKVFHYQQGTLTSCDNSLFPNLTNGKNIMDYLGFSFDGNKISIRDKTVSKYYYRMNRRATIVGRRSAGLGQNGKRPDYYGLYKKYSHLGMKPTKGNHGNFITYVNRCIDVFGMSEKVHVVKQRHMRKMNRIIKSN